MGYDFFTQPKGPDIDVSLFPDAMRAGAAVGNSIQSPTAAIINGLLGGLKTGEDLVQGYQQIQQNQNTIEQMPLTNELRRQSVVKGQHEIERAPVEEEINDTLNRQKIKANENTLEQAPVTNEIQRQQMLKGQNEVSQLPVANRQEEARATREEALAAAEKMKLEIDEKTQSLRAAHAVKELEQKGKQVDQESEDMKLKEELGGLMASPNADAKRSILTNSKLQGLLLRDKELAQSTYGSLASSMDPTTGKPIFSPEEQNGFVKRVNILEAEKIDARERETAARLDAKVSGGVESAYEKMMQSNGALRGVIKGLSASEIANNVEIFPKGSRQLIPGTRKINPAASVNSVTGWNEAMGYDVAVNGELQEFSLSADDASRTFAFQDSFARLTGRKMRPTQAISMAPQAGPPGAPQQQQSAPPGAQQTPAPQATPQSAPMTPVQPRQGQARASESDAAPFQVKDMGQLSANISENTKAPEDDVTRIMMQGQEAGKNRNWITKQRDAIASVTPEFLKGHTFDRVITDTGLAGEDKLTSDVRSVAKGTAEMMAARTLERYQNADDEGKQIMDDWGKANNVPMDFTKLKNHFMKETVGALSKGYDTMYQQGVDEAAGIQNAKNAKDNARREAQEALKGKPLESIAKVQQSLKAIEGAPLPPVKQEPEPTPVEDAKAKVPQVAAEYNLGPKTSANLEKVAERVSGHPLLADASPLVKAIVSQESAGNPAAISPTGVKGLMQVTQKTAGRYKLDRNDPEQNVLAGELYLADLVTMFKGDEYLATASYNGGEGTIKYAQQLAGSDNWEDIKPHIYDALAEMKRRGHLPKDMNLVKKAKEVIQYPERVQMYKKLYVA